MKHYIMIHLIQLHMLCYHNCFQLVFVVVSDYSKAVSYIVGADVFDLLHLL